MSFPLGEGCPAEASAQADPNNKMKYVYILQSVDDSDRHYTGLTDNLKERLEKHKAGGVAHTSKYAPWRLQTYIAFSDERRAHAFERYLKTGSGRAFAKKRL